MLRCLKCAAVAVVMSITVAQPLAAQSADTFKIAYWNIKSGWGQPALPGITSTFSLVSNCTDPSQPLNAWGIGFVQAELVAALGNDASVVALGLGESWQTVCGSPRNVRDALKWKSHSSERNGTAIVARHGFAGPEQWIQLDTSLNPNPADTTWVLHVPVCLDAACSKSISVFTTHWYATGPSASLTYERQAQDTIAFMAKLAADRPHVMIGDLNVWERPEPKVCDQVPRPEGLGQLRQAGYIDAWPRIHGAAEGYTGMLNRHGCGDPHGWTWKRIDYAWSTPDLPPQGIRRFGVVTPGQQAPSDHLGIVAEYRRPGSPDVLPPSVAITSPADGARVSGTVTIDISATDDTGIDRVELLINQQVATVLRTSPFRHSWSTTTVADGTYRLEARAYDVTGKSATSLPVQVTVANSPAPNVPPAVTVTSPAPGASFVTPATINIAASASDSDGTIASVQFFAGSTLIGTATKSPYSVTWNVSTAGTYSLTARATDNLGAATTSAPVSITVQPGALSLTATAPSNGRIRVTLRWSGGTGGAVDVFRNNVRIATVSGTSHVDDLGTRPKGQFTYRVCQAGTATCSNSVTLNY